MQPEVKPLKEGDWFLFPGFFVGGFEPPKKYDIFFNSVKKPFSFKISGDFGRDV